MKFKISFALTVLFLSVIACGTATTQNAPPQATNPSFNSTELPNIPATQTAPSMSMCKNIPTREPSEILERGNIHLAHRQSYNFASKELGILDGGDLYVILETPPAFFANNDPQQGGLDLGKPCQQDLQLESVSVPTDMQRYSRKRVPVVVGHVYVYLQETVGNVVVFRVTAIEPEISVDLEYVVIKTP